MRTKQVMATASEQRSLPNARDKTGVALASFGLGIVIVVTVAFYGTGASAMVAIGVAAGYAFGLSAALVQRNTRHWRRLLTRIEAETRRRLTSTEQTSMFSSRVFYERLDQECRRSSRYGLELSVLRLRCDPDAVARLGAADDAAATIVTAAAVKLRSEDVVGRLSELEYAFFLPHTNRDGAEIVIGRMQSLGSLVHSLGMAVFGDDGSGPHDLLRAAGADAERRLLHAERERGWNQRALVN